MLKNLDYIIRKFFFLKFGYVIDKRMLGIDRKRDFNHLYDDYIRKSSVELVSYEIYRKKILGSCAEAGVYRGYFAEIINFYFPDRKLYLFDTFEGFDLNDVNYDKEKQFPNSAQDFSDTNIDLVINIMPNKNNIIIKKGTFPESASDVEDSFCFVSIDLDLYKPIKSALEFFYPRLNKGGYIFVHDFNNKSFKGSNKAVLEFSEKNNVPYFPLSDIWGTAILMK